LVCESSQEEATEAEPIIHLILSVMFYLVCLSSADSVPHHSPCCRLLTRRVCFSPDIGQSVMGWIADYTAGG